MLVSLTMCESATNGKVSDGSQPSMTWDLSLTGTAGSRSLHRLDTPQINRRSFPPQCDETPRQHVVRQSIGCTTESAQQSIALMKAEGHETNFLDAFVSFSAAA
jgi:hypothetical protein